MRIVTPEYLNSNQSLFGGYLVCWIDEIAYMCARRFTGSSNCVTVQIDNLIFRVPLRLGDQVNLCAKIVHVGTTSMEITVIVTKEDARTGEFVFATQANLTFVNLDENHRPLKVPRLNPQDSVSKEGRDAHIRIRVRKRLQSFLERQENSKSLTSQQFS